jgi:hypothetical protein
MERLERQDATGRETLSKANILNFGEMLSSQFTLPTLQTDEFTRKDPCKPPGAVQPPGVPSEIDRDKKLRILDPTTGHNIILARWRRFMGTSQDIASSFRRLNTEKVASIYPLFQE